MSTLAYVGPGADGQDCINTFDIGTRALVGQGGGGMATGPEAVDEFRAQGYELCPPGAQNPAAMAAVVTPQIAAWLVWHEQVQLPSPTLNIAPGSAVTGLLAYLEIGGPQTDQRQFGPAEALGYTITLDITSVYDVDWGDGTVVTVSSQGGPYPTGDVSHRYQHVDDDNVVTVTQRWSATWTATDGSGVTTTGTIAAPLYTQSAFELPVGEIQAVRNY